MKFQIYRSGKDRQFYWRLVSHNGNVIAQGEGYKRRAGALKAIRAVQKSQGAAVILPK